MPAASALPTTRSVRFRRPGAYIGPLASLLGCSHPSARGTMFRPVPDAMRSTGRVVREIAGQCGYSLPFGFGVTDAGMRILNMTYGLPQYFEGPHHQFAWTAFPVLFTGALVGSCLAMMWRTMTR